MISDRASIHFIMVITDSGHMPVCCGSTLMTTIPDPGWDVLGHKNGKFINTVLFNKLVIVIIFL